MREDMFKIIVERPRRRNGDPPVLSRDGRHFRNRVWPDEDGGNAPPHFGMKAGYRNCKYPNENLAPLQRWLASQVNRPWDKVYADLCANIDRRSTVQEHIFTHIRDFVAIDTALVEGEVITRENWRRENLPVAEARQELFVHPRTGILLANRARLRLKREKEAVRQRERSDDAGQRKVLGESAQLVLINGDWFEVKLARLPEGVPTGKVGPYGRVEHKFERRWDVALRKSVAQDDSGGTGSCEALSGKRGWYAVEKHQLGKSEIKRHALKQKAGTSRPFCWRRIVLSADKLVIAANAWSALSGRSPS